MAMKRQLSDTEVLEQLMREMAERETLIRETRENLEKYGTALPPLDVTVSIAATRMKGERPAPKEVERVTATGRGRGNARRVPAAQWFNVMKICPHCGLEKNVGKDFGTVIRRGKETAASWCKNCRATSDYHAKDRDWAAINAKRKRSTKKD